MSEPEPSWMRVFEGKALAAALTEAGHEVSEKTVQRWKAGDTKPKPQDIRAIQSLIGAETQKEAAPDISGRLDEIDVRVRQLTVGLALMSPAIAEAMRQAAIEAAETPDVTQRGAKRQGPAGRR